MIYTVLFFFFFKEVGLSRLAELTNYIIKGKKGKLEQYD